ncbi:peptidoglycan-binding protein [Funiculus sociatus GB2-M2]|uniref:peptidoglycan-binding domain-containing protein n=1 Tax=Funiculus sociatus TaxID=450527 RepID=UPI003297E27F
MFEKNRFINWLNTPIKRARTSQSKVEPVILTFPSPTLYKGQVSDAIRSATKQLQQLLQAQGFACQVTGEFDLDTDTAVRNFQGQCGLVVDGVVGSLTWARLFYPTLYRSIDDESPEMKESVEKLKQLLEKEGFSTGKDLVGQFGKGTEKAVKAFQRTFGLRENGIADAMTIAILLGLLQRSEKIKGSVSRNIYISRADLSSRCQEIAQVSCIVLGMNFGFGASELNPPSGAVAWVTAIGIASIVPWLSACLLPKPRLQAKSLLGLYGPYILSGILWRQVLIRLIGVQG